MRALLVTLLLAGATGPQNKLTSGAHVSSRSSSSSSIAFFEFAPTNGAGMGTACGACANTVKSPESFDSADWTTVSIAVAAPTVTANAAIAPNGALTAERIQIPATAAAQNSIIFQAGCPTSGTVSLSIWVLGNASSGTTDLAINDGVCAAGVCPHIDCSFVSSGWTLCKKENVAVTSVGNFIFGNYTSNNGGTTRSAADVFVVGAQCNAGATVNTYTPLPTGSKNEAMAFPRASSGTCLKGNTSLVANGDMLTCANGQARVGPGGDGTGPLKLLVESSRTNSLLRSQELANVVWTNDGDSAPRTPTVTSDAATAPDGTVTAERIQYPATNGALFSETYQTFTVATGSGIACSVFVQGRSTSDTTDLCLYDGAAWSCSACAYVTAGYQRCSQAVASGTGTSRYCKLGNNSSQNGAVARNAADLNVWGFQGEAGAYATSYIATAGATATRARDVPSVTLPVAMNASTGSHAASLIPEWSLATQPGDNFLLAYDNTAEVLFAESTGPNRVCTYDGTNQICIASTSWNTSTAVRMWSSYTGSTQTVNNGNTQTGAFDGTMGSSALAVLSIGTRSDGFAVDGWIGQVCSDPNQLRCR